MRAICIHVHCLYVVWISLSDNSVKSRVSPSTVNVQSDTESLMLKSSDKSDPMMRVIERVFMLMELIQSKNHKKFVKFKLVEN